mmetsp:Transcript_28918/g.52340  ORF Transcript_28918/g.52340 Transcript_28918/m.52340 type:complete len:360 (-) Transcript_28918:888-1967(-)
MSTAQRAWGQRWTRGALETLRPRTRWEWARRRRRRVNKKARRSRRRSWRGQLLLEPLLRRQNQSLALHHLHHLLYRSAAAADAPCALLVLLARYPPLHRHCLLLLLRHRLRRRRLHLPPPPEFRRWRAASQRPPAARSRPGPCWLSGRAHQTPPPPPTPGLRRRFCGPSRAPMLSRLGRCRACASAGTRPRPALPAAPPRAATEGPQTRGSPRSTTPKAFRRSSAPQKRPSPVELLSRACLRRRGGCSRLAAPRPRAETGGRGVRRWAPGRSGLTHQSCATTPPSFSSLFCSLVSRFWWKTRRHCSQQASPPCWRHQSAPPLRNRKRRLSCSSRLVSFSPPGRVQLQRCRFQRHPPLLQ